jgi:hypothetical protein
VIRVASSIGMTARAVTDCTCSIVFSAPSTI